MFCQNILEAIGRTPLVKLNRIGSHLKCNLFAKAEFMNPGGSVKDRIGYRMVMDAEKKGQIRPGDTLIEPTSGNTGIGIALAGAVRGYRVIITMPEKMSREKQIILEALGAEIIRTPTEAASDSPESHISLARRLKNDLPNAHILDQYGNPSNPQVHYDTTAVEILEDIKSFGNVDMIVGGAGTGGTISGCARKLKEVNPKTIVVGADPVGSILGGGETISSYKVEGIGYDFFPDVLDTKLVDRWVKTTDQDSFILARKLIKEEGLLVGGSSGSALFAALEEAKKLDKGQNCVVILPDGVRNYMSKFIDDKWMRDNRFFGAEIRGGTVNDLIAHKPSKQLYTIEETASVESAIDMMRNKGISQIPVTREKKLIGLVSETDLVEYFSHSHASNQAPVAQVMSRSVASVDETTPVNMLQEILMSHKNALVVNQRGEPQHILTKIDLLEWLVSSRR